MTKAQHATAIAGGVLITVFLWEAAGRSAILGSGVPPVSSVFAYLLDSAHYQMLISAVLHTAKEASEGLIIGATIGIGLATVTALIPPAAEGLAALASLINGIPIVAVAGVCLMTLPREATPLIVSALGVSFVVFVGAVSGFGSASACHRDLFAVCGASRGVTFARLLVPSALPAIVDGVRAAAPQAVVGAIVGEWFASGQGLGQLLVAAMQNFATLQLWAAAILSTALAMAAYAVLSLLRGRVATGLLQ